MANSADPGQLPTDLDLHSLQREGIYGFSMTRVKQTAAFYGTSKHCSWRVNTELTSCYVSIYAKRQIFFLYKHVLRD